MEWLAQNWTLLVVLGAIIGVAIYYAKGFSKLPAETQLHKVKEWLLWAVIYTERELGAGTGVAKLRFCYDLFLQRFPSLVSVISFEMFSDFVDEALVQMKKILETNKDIEEYVKGDVNLKD